MRSDRKKSKKMDFSGETDITDWMRKKAKEGSNPFNIVTHVDGHKIKKDDKGHTMKADMPIHVVKSEGGDCKYCGKSMPTRKLR